MKNNATKLSNNFNLRTAEKSSCFYQIYQGLFALIGEKISQIYLNLLFHSVPECTFYILQNFKLFFSKSSRRKQPSVPGGGGGLPYETDGDARRLA